MMILDRMFSILINTSELLFSLTFSLAHSSFVRFNGGNGPLLRFDVYDQNTDYYKCDADCKWYVHKDGLCRNEQQDNSSYVRKCYPWKQ